jgi:hypothetical protein
MARADYSAARDVTGRVLADSARFTLCSATK